MSSRILTSGKSKTSKLTDLKKEDGVYSAGNGHSSKTINALPHIIRTDEEALDVVTGLAAKFKTTSADLDRHPRVPLEEVEEITQSGLLGSVVPKEYGGAGISAVTLAKILQILSAADGSLGQIHQNHFFFVNRVTAIGSLAQKKYFHRQFLEGKRLGNCLSEPTGRHGLDLNTRLTRQADGTYRLNGQKFYTTGAYLAHFLPVLAGDADGKPPVFAYVSRHAPGVEVTNDWSGMGQRNTVSGTAIFKDVIVTEDIIFRSVDEGYSPHGLLFAQLMHAAIDTGIAQAAFEDTIWFIRNHARPWGDAKVEKAGDDPHVIKHFGELSVQYHAAEALLLRAAEAIDQARLKLGNEKSVVDAIVAVGEARVQADRASLQLSNDLFELSGTRSAVEKWNLNRHWRNARTHTLHDPVRWKLHHIGNYYLNGVKPAVRS